MVVCVTLHCAQLHFFIFSRCFKGTQFSREQNNKFNMKIKQVMDLLFFRIRFWLEKKNISNLLAHTLTRLILNRMMSFFRFALFRVLFLVVVAF